MKKTPLILDWLKTAASASLLTLALVACKKDPPDVIVNLPGNYSQVTLLPNTAAQSRVGIDTVPKDAGAPAFAGAATAGIWPLASAVGGVGLCSAGGREIRAVGMLDGRKRE